MTERDREPSMTEKAEVYVHEGDADEKKLTRSLLFKLDTRYAIS